METTAAAAATQWPLREEALRRLTEFVPRAGRAYAATRNFDRGPADRANVSQLSPFVRTRLLSETEALAAVLATHTQRGAEKFVSEIFWRTYWKGWLQAHPDAWTRYRAGLEVALSELDDPGKRIAYDRAVNGATGVAAFDAWVRELGARNYLHNHARMWFASMWTFTLGLRWELGADLFMRQLLDGDPASNTLSWRWVAGLHTRGRTYAATSANIERYTAGRFAPAEPLARTPTALIDAPLELRPLPELPASTAVGDDALLLVHDDDLHGDLRDVPRGLRGVAAIVAASGRSPLPLSAAVVAFTDQAARESTAHIAQAAGAHDAGLLDVASGIEGLESALRACGATRVIAAYAPVGPVRDVLDALRGRLVERGWAYGELGRRYDAVAWPAATRGFFDLRRRIPAILSALEIGAG